MRARAGSGEEGWRFVARWGGRVAGLTECEEGKETQKRAPIRFCFGFNARARPLLLPTHSTMSLQATTTRNTITLQGSAKIVGEFFAYAVNR